MRENFSLSPPFLNCHYIMLMTELEEKQHGGWGGRAGEQLLPGFCVCLVCKHVCVCLLVATPPTPHPGESDHSKKSCACAVNGKGVGAEGVGVWGWEGAVEEKSGAFHWSGKYSQVQAAEACLTGLLCSTMQATVPKQQLKAGPFHP